MQAANKIDGVRITAVCDIWDRHLAEGSSWLSRRKDL